MTTKICFVFSEEFRNKNDCLLLFSNKLAQDLIDIGGSLDAQQLPPDPTTKLHRVTKYVEDVLIKHHSGAEHAAD